MNLRELAFGWTRRACLIGLSIAGSLLLPCGALAQVIFNVNTTDDGADFSPGDGNCSTVAAPAPPICTLRAAVMQANRIPGAGALIVLPAGTFKLTIPATVDGGEENGDLDVFTPAGYSPGPITITGQGTGVTIIDGQGITRVLSIGENRVVAISGVSIVNGLTRNSNGGCIYNAGDLTLRDSTISNCAATFSDPPQLNDYSYGGGIYSNGSGLHLIRVSIVGNNALSGGGGVLAGYGSVVVEQSLIAGNTALRGGGVNAVLPDLSIVNTTISQNGAVVDGGGIYNEFGTLHLNNSTVAYNQAGLDGNKSGVNGPGIYNTGDARLRNNVVAGNSYPGPYGLTLYSDCQGTLTTYGRNRFYTLNGCTVTQGDAGSATQLVPSAALGALKDNGGPTQTIALIPVANANLIDYASTCLDQNSQLLTVDQRGRPRAVGASCDVGAFEYDPGDIFFNGFQ